jgi:hypothetical protein
MLQAATGKVAEQETLDIDRIKAKANDRQSRA